MTAEGDQPSLRSGWQTMASVVVALFIVILDSTIVNVALPSLQATYGTTLNQAQWIVSVYMLALGVATPLAGFLGDRFGSKRVFVLALVVFALASFACGLAPDLGTLVLARAVQGLAGGLAGPIAIARLFTAFPPHRRGLALGVVSGVTVLAPLLGPVLGGWFVVLDATRWIFYVNVPIIGVGGLLALWLLPEQRPERRQQGDPLGVVLSVLGFGGILYALSALGDPGKTDTVPVLVGTLVGILALVALVRFELRRQQPLLDPRLFGRRHYGVANATNFLGQVAFIGLPLLVPLDSQTRAGLSALDAGLLMLPMFVASGASGVLGGLLIDRYGPRIPLVVGLTVLGAGYLVLADSGVTASTVAIGALVAAGIGSGLLPPGTQHLALNGIPRLDVGRATSLFQVIQRVAQALGVALLTTMASSFGFTAAYLVAAGCAATAVVLMLSMTTTAPRTVSRYRG